VAALAGAALSEPGLFDERGAHAAARTPEAPTAIAVSACRRLMLTWKQRT
jgi:hypothetical protein